jgi:hypothetical protein
LKQVDSTTPDAITNTPNLACEALETTRERNL